MDPTSCDVVYNKLTDMMVKVYFTLPSGTQLSSWEIMQAALKYLNDEGNSETVSCKLYSLALLGNEPLGFMMGYIVHAIIAEQEGVIGIDTEVATQEAVALHLSASLERSAALSLKFSKEIRAIAGVDGGVVEVE